MFAINRYETDYTRVMLSALARSLPASTLVSTPSRQICISETGLFGSIWACCRQIGLCLRSCRDNGHRERTCSVRSVGGPAMPSGTNRGIAVAALPGERRRQGLRHNGQKPLGRCTRCTDNRRGRRARACAVALAGLLAAAGTPNDIVARLNATAVAALSDASVRQRLDDLGQEIPPPEQQTPAALGAYHKAEIEKWWPIIKAAGIKAE